MEREPRQYTASEVRAEMARKRCSQIDAAKALGLTRQGFQNKYYGRRPFTSDELALLADLLGVPVMQFMPKAAEVTS